MIKCSKCPQNKTVSYPKWYILDNMNVLDIKQKKGKGKKKRPSYGLDENAVKDGE